MRYADIAKKYLTDDTFDKNLVNKTRCFNCDTKAQADDEVFLVSRSKRESMIDELDASIVKWTTVEADMWYCAKCYKKIYQKARLGWLT